MTNTPNYNLEKPEYNDYADISIINNNMDKIDTELKKVSDKGNGAIENDLGIASQLRWRNYGQGHSIFDASKGITPSGTTCSNTNPSNFWSATFPTLMGWNGSQTYGVRVDRSRIAEDSERLIGKNWYWQGQDGQPTWIWGGNDGNNMYVYNPSNFNVNHANTCNVANSVQGFQFRNNGGKLEILINGVWLSVGSKQYTVVRQGKIESGQRFDYSGGAGVIRRAFIAVGNNDAARCYIDGVRVMPYYRGSTTEELENIEFKNSISFVTDVPNGYYKPSIEYLIQTEY